MQVSFNKTVPVNASTDKVWRIFAHEFDDAHKWMASVPHSHGHAVGEKFEDACTAGRVCSLDGNPNGMKASEQFLAYDEEAKTCTIRIDFLNTMAVFPIDHNKVDFSIVDAGDGKSEMTWAFSSQIKPWAFFLWPVIRLGFGFFVGQIIEELVYYAENDAPHPRKVKALTTAGAAA